MSNSPAPRSIAKSKPVIYFAGKIAQCDWRWEITGNSRVGGLTDQDDEEMAYLLDPTCREEYGAFLYGGPFFISCDHGCAHSTRHANGTNCGHELPDYADILKVNTQRILGADWMFAYINEVDCFGTLIELGIAHQHPRTRIAVAFGPQVTKKQRGDLWMAEECADEVFIGPTVEAVWTAFALKHLPLWIPSLRRTAAE